MNKKDRSRKLFDAIGKINDDIVEEVSLKGKGRKNIFSVYRMTGVIAAAAVLVFLAKSLLPTGVTDQGKALAQVVYPEKAAYEDHEKRIDIQEKNKVPDEFLAGLTDFSYKTGAEFLKDDGKNKNFSPLSLYYALSVAFEGAGSDTKKEIAALLEIKDMEKQSEMAEKLYRSVFFDNEMGKLLIADSLWMDDEVNGVKYAFKDAFVNKIVKNYFASSHMVDFENKDTGKIIGRWINENTGGMLSPEIESSSDTVMSIINTVYFKDQWAYGFDRSMTAPDSFNLKDGRKVTADFLNKEIFSGQWAKGDGFSRTSLQLKNGSRMVFILPDKGITTGELLKDKESVKNIFQGGEEKAGKITLKIPKFKFSNDFDLKEGLKNLGMKAAFDPEKSDFSNISDNPLFVSSVKQGSAISIDENGVEASSYTDISLSGAAMPVEDVEMIFDRPFIYGIQHYNGTVLFMGVVENPIE